MRPAANSTYDVDRTELRDMTALHRGDGVNVNPVQNQ